MPTASLSWYQALNCQHTLMVVMIMQFKNEEKRRLPLAKASKGTSSLPDAAAVGKLFETATTLEGSVYAQNEYRNKVDAAGRTEDLKPVLAEFKNNVAIKEASDQRYCFGEPPESKDMIYQKNLAGAAVKALEEIAITKIDFDFAINDTSNLVQASSVDRKPLDPAVTQQINHIYSYWLSNNQMVCKEGVIYENETVKKDINEDDSLKRVNPSKYVNLFMDKEKGFAAFVKKETTIKDKPNSAIEISVTDRSAELVASQQPKG